MHFIYPDIESIQKHDYLGFSYFPVKVNREHNILLTIPLFESLFDGSVFRSKRIVILVGKPMPANTGFAFQQFNGKILIEITPVLLGLAHSSQHRFYWANLNLRLWCTIL